MTIYSSIGFLFAIVILAATPGPGMFATIARALASGFIVVFLPAFLDLSTLTTLDLFVVVIIVTTGVTSVLGTYAFLACKTRQMFTNKKTAKRFNKVAGGVMVATGAALVTQ